MAIMLTTNYFVLIVVSRPILFIIWFSKQLEIVISICKLWLNKILSLSLSSLKDYTVLMVCLQITIEWETHDNKLSWRFLAWLQALFTNNTRSLSSNEASIVTFFHYDITHTICSHGWEVSYLETDGCAGLPNYLFISCSHPCHFFFFLKNHIYGLFTHDFHIQWWPPLWALYLLKSCPWLIVTSQWMMILLGILLWCCYGYRQWKMILLGILLWCCYG